MNILIVAPYFPPQKTVAVVRIASLTRYLIKQGCQVTVLTNKYYEEKEETNDFVLENIKKIEVENTREKFFVRKKIYEDKFIEVMDNNNFDCIFITGGPFYTFSLCKIAKKRYNTKCIVDFRDLWIFDMRSKKEFYKPMNIMKKVIFYPIERNAIKYADVVLTVTEGWGRILKKVYFKYKDKVEIIFNGYDLEDISTKPKEPRDDGRFNIEGFKIMTFGKLTYYSEYYSTIFLKALKRICNEYSHVRLIQIGTEEERTINIMKEVGMHKEKYVNTGFCQYHQGIRILQNANVCVIIDIRNHAIGTKIYDYIYINKPIIYIGKKNTQLAKLVTSFESGFSCQTEEEVYKAITEIANNKIDYLTNKKNINKYSREYQNEKVFSVLKKLTEG
ncbi:glycosyltransferase [Ornithinibacillus sp. 4-3]|uniref:Glycosyltransferase n=1 Tax=Ornithinibacillus sp. 4-3 TaxID=3231488 RepID=A0AB39HPF0_9BACI